MSDSDKLAEEIMNGVDLRPAVAAVIPALDEYYKISGPFTASELLGSGPGGFEPDMFMIANLPGVEKHSWHGKRKKIRSSYHDTHQLEEVLPQLGWKKKSVGESSDWNKRITIFYK